MILSALPMTDASAQLGESHTFTKMQDKAIYMFSLSLSYTHTQNLQI